jgi:hypothetical protein
MEEVQIQSDAKIVEDLKSKQPKVFSRMGKATESSFNILKSKNLDEI